MGHCTSKTRAETHTLVIVDDSVGILTSLDWVLHEEGYSVHTFTWGGSALEFIRNNPVHLVISDFHMPGMDGIEFARLLRQSGWDGAFIFMSGHVPELKQFLSEELKVSRVVQKPFDVVELMESVSDTLQGHGCGS